MRLGKRNEQGGGVVVSAVKIFFQMNLGASVEVDNAFLVAFTQHDAFPVLEVDVVSVEFNELPNAHAGRCEQVYNCQIARRFRSVAHAFECFVRVNLFNHARRFDFPDASNWAFKNVIFGLKP